MPNSLQSIAINSKGYHEAAKLMKKDDKAIEMLKQSINHNNGNNEARLMLADL